ncbi:MAG: hypothetical protein ACI9MR_002499, partial [Myxococcota bacterium]
MKAACKTTQLALAHAIALADLNAPAALHAETCSVCGLMLTQRQALAEVTLRARDAHLAIDDLPPSSWVAIRAGVDARVARDKRRFFGVSAPKLAVFTMTAALCAVAAWFVLGHDDPATARLDARTLAASTVASPLQVAVAPAATEGGERVVVSEGTVLETADVVRAFAAYGRHTVTVDATSKVAVQRWDSQKIALDLAVGKVTCDVNRSATEEIFEVHAGDVSVRVLGTVFSVERDDKDRVTVAVTRGRVAVKDGDDETVYVSAGESRVFPAEPTTAAVGTPAERSGPVVAEVKGPVTRRAGTHRSAPSTKVREIDVPAQAMDAPVVDYKLDSVLPAVMLKMRSGRCDQALP